ncbi:MAG TPA: cellulose binding domain-containing protein [Kineosporiaceae bacterium]|nr:cellulose binding domain-containing protein [Kineosporiaceae bacterium]
MSNSSAGWSGPRRGVPSPDLTGRTGPGADPAVGDGAARRAISRRRVGAVVAAMTIAGSAVAISGVASTFHGSSASAASAGSGYTWKNVQIYGGGFIPGIEYSRAEKGLAYVRTDIGGIYRRDPGSTTWTPLTDWAGPDDWGYNGPVSVAPDPVDADKVYAAVGMYTNDWDPNNGAVIRSSDRGKTWQIAKLPFKQGGNMPGRGTGERLAVDPHKNSVLYLGAPNGNGLWRSTDSGATWARVTSLTNTGSYADKPGDAYQGVPNGILWVTFDPRSGSGTGANASATKTIYVGVADKENPVYRSTDAGATWTPVKGTPTGYMAHHGVLDEKTGMFFIATSDTVGPYDGAHGDVWRLDTSDDSWKQVSPIPSSNTSDNYFGYSGLTVDRQKPGTLMVSAYSSWWPDTIFWRSTDSGATWTKVWDWTSYPNRSFRYTLDASASPWLDFNNDKPSPPDTAPRLGWMTEAMEIDPFSSDNLLYGTGATLYGTNNLTDWDASKVKISVMAKGIEETAALDLMSPPSGAPLVSGLGDISGFVHDDLDKVPAHMFAQPTMTTTSSLDFVESEPKVMVRAGHVNRDTDKNVKALAFSTDGGKTWFQANAEPPGTSSGGSVAAAAAGQRFVWAPLGGPVSYSEGFGNSWTPVKGLDNESVVKSDRVNAKKFYAYKGGRFFVSQDGGATFTQTVGSGLPSDVTLDGFRVAPGKEGDIWLGGSSGMFRSTDSGQSFKPVAGVDKVWSLGFGKAAPGKDFPAVYTTAKISGRNGVFRSDDAGASWVRINDDQHQWGMPTVTIGDPRVYGRVYLGTNGRGVIYGDGEGGAPVTPAPSGSTSAPAPSTSTSTGTSAPAPSTSTSTGTSAPAPSSSTSTSAPATPACTAQVHVNAWPGGYLGTVTVLNSGPAAQPWTVTFTIPTGVKVWAGWNADVKVSGTTVTATAPSWNRTLASGREVSIGLIASGPATSAPGQIALNGNACGSSGTTR